MLDNLIDKYNYTANLIPDLSYFSYYENLLAFRSNKNMISDLFIRHDCSTNNQTIIESTRCLLLSDFILTLINGKDEASRKTEFAEIGRYGSRRVYCFYRSDEDSDDTEYKIAVTDNSNYTDKYFEELRF